MASFNIQQRNVTEGNIAMKHKMVQTVRLRSAIVLVLAATAAPALLLAGTRALAGKTTWLRMSLPGIAFHWQSRSREEKDHGTR